jgi:hypothetical protein
MMDGGLNLPDGDEILLALLAIVVLGIIIGWGIAQL